MKNRKRHEKRKRRRKGGKGGGWKILSDEDKEKIENYKKLTKERKTNFRIVVWGGGLMTLIFCYFIYS